MASFNENYSIDDFICFGFTYETVYVDYSFCYAVDYEENAVYVCDFKFLIVSNGRAN